MSKIQLIKDGKVRAVDTTELKKYLKNGWTFYCNYKTRKGM